MTEELTQTTSDTPEDSLTDTSTAGKAPELVGSPATSVPAAEVEEAVAAAGKAVDATIKANTTPAHRPRPDQRYKVVVATNELQLADLLNVEYQNLYRLCSGPTAAAMPNGRVIYACVVEKFNG